MDPDTDVCQTEQPQISYSVDFTAEQSSAMGSPILLGREGTHLLLSLSLMLMHMYTPTHRVNLSNTSYASAEYAVLLID